jgi:hypothetical protein
MTCAATERVPQREERPVAAQGANINAMKTGGEEPPFQEPMAASDTRLSEPTLKTERRCQASEDQRSQSDPVGDRNGSQGGGAPALW